MTVSRMDARADAPGLVPDAAVPVNLAPDLPSVEFCDGYAAKFCERLLVCSRPYLDGVYGTMERCQERLGLECRTEATLAGSGLVGAAGMACAQALGMASCEDLLGNSVPACQVKGTLAKGAACGSGSQCASGFCRRPETAFCGTCDSAGAADAPCDSDDSCQFPLLCSEAGRCAQPAAEGEFCNETRPCQAALLFCAADNTCKRPSAEGKACNRSAPMPLQPCEIGFSCRPSANGLCRGIRLVAVRSDLRDRGQHRGPLYRLGQLRERCVQAARSGRRALHGRASRRLRRLSASGAVPGRVVQAPRSGIV